MVSSTLTARVLDGYAQLPAAVWEQLLKGSDTKTVFQTQGWQQAWWEIFGRGQLLLITAERADETVALAPLFADGGMIFFVGSGGSDYLDFIGDHTEPGTLELLLETAREQTRDFVGFRFYHVPDDSRTGARLWAAAQVLGWLAFDEGSHPAPALDLVSDPTRAAMAAARKSLLRHERYFTRTRRLKVEHLREAKAILPELPGFMAQHRDRWANTSSPSLFCEPQQQRFYERLTHMGAHQNWLRFTRLDWEERPIAYHFGFSYAGSFLWYKPSFDISLARHSPGEVLLRQLLLESVAQGEHTFDFGLGDEPFKHRFASHVRHVRTWGLYPPEHVRSSALSQGELP